MQDCSCRSDVTGEKQPVIVVIGGLQPEFQMDMAANADLSGAWLKGADPKAVVSTRHHPM